MLNRSACLSNSVLKALQGKLNIKKPSASILYFRCPFEDDDTAVVSSLFDIYNFEAILS